MHSERVHNGRCDLNTGDSPFSDTVIVTKNNCGNKSWYEPNFIIDESFINRYTLKNSRRKYNLILIREHTSSDPNRIQLYEYN